MELSFRVFLIAVIGLLVSCAGGGTYESRPIEVSGCGATDYMNPCITKDVVTPNEKTATCVQTPTGWAFRANKYLLNNPGGFEWRKILPRSGTPNNYENCSVLADQGRLVEGTYALAQHSGVMVTAAGDVCDLRPVITIHRYLGDWLLKRENYSHVPKYQTIRFQDPAYEFYVGNHNAHWINTNLIDRRILALPGLISQQCGKLPDSIIIRGVFIEPSKSTGYRYDVEGEYKELEIYRGLYQPADPRGFRIEHANAQRGQELYEYAKSLKNEADSRRAEAYYKEQERLINSSKGALLLLQGLIGIHATSPCRDPDIDDSQRPWDCDPNVAPN